MTKLLTILLSGAAGLVLVVLLSAAALSTARKNAISPRSQPVLNKIKQLEEKYPGGQPKAATLKTEFDFGILNPGDTKSHSFVIRNEGLAILALKQGTTTCKCTVADLRDKSLFPGKETEVSLEWNTGRTEADFRQSATILTNDPDRPEIVFYVNGKVRLTCFVEPQAVVFPDILPGKAETAETMVCSQAWDSFTISKIESSVEGLSWKLEPLPADELRAAEVRSGYRLVLTSPANLLEDRLSGSLKFVAEGPDGAREPFEIPLGGKLRRRIAVYGPQIDEHGVIELGNLPSGRGAKVPLTLRVRDEVTELPVREIRVRPDFVKAVVTPYVDASGTPKPALYHLDIEIPPDAPIGHYKGVHQGQVHVEFDHPRAKDVTIKLSFVVAPNPIQ